METTLAPAGDPNDMAAIEAELTPLTSGRLRSVLVESCGSAVSHIARAAVCVKLLEARGEDLHGIPQLGLFRRIASGLVLPDVVWKYSEAPGRQVIVCVWNARSEERRVGKECLRLCRSRWSPYH